MLKQPPQKPALNTSSVDDATLPDSASESDSVSNPDSASTLGSVSDSEADSASTGVVSTSVKPSKKRDGRFQLSMVKKAFPKIPAVSKRKAAAMLGLLGAGSGFAFTQVAPADVQSTVLPDRLVVESPLRRDGDPAAEPFVINTRGMFLTHQIFYRKVEALARIPGGVVTTPGKAAGKTTGKATGTAVAVKPSEGAKAKGNKGESAAVASQPTVTPTQAAIPATSAAPSSEKVVAAAPPTPAVVDPAPLGTTIDSILEMRVAVAKDVSAISFAVSNGGTLTDLDGNVLKSLSPETAAYADIGEGIVVDGETLPTAFWVYPENGGYVAIGDSWYRGRVLMALRERGLIAVNYVLLGEYLYSVVGTEMSPDWALESLKAQAVAARSYALTHNIHPASEAYFDLDNTQRFQAYKGIDREASTTQAAVQATAGEFISHDGGIVESLYAASQAIVDDAHKGSGMSQLGARDLAEQGHDYTSILGHYYPGTALGRIDADTD